MLPTGTSYWMNYVLRSVKVSDITQHTELQNPYQLDSWWMFWPGSSFECLKGPLTLLLFYLIRSFTPKGIYLKEASSGLEPESPVHFRTWTWNAVNNLLVYKEAIGFKKLISSEIWCLKMMEFLECRMDQFSLVSFLAWLAVMYFTLFNNVVSYPNFFVECNQMSDQEIVYRDWRIYLGTSIRIIHF